jgi:hypothetical protein
MRADPQLNIERRCQTSSMKKCLGRVQLTPAGHEAHDDARIVLHIACLGSAVKAHTHNGAAMANAHKLTNNRLMPASLHRLPATRCAIFNPGSDTIGTPAHRASVAVVCALNSGVSRNTSARPLIKNSRSLGNMSLMTMREKSTPSASDSALRFLGPSTASNLINHSFVEGTARMIAIHTFQRSGVIL